MRVRDARLLISAGGLGDFPRAGLPEIAFSGRSNVGKSSLLNKLVGRHKLARISSTPGCTQRVNFFQLDDRLLFADLPGYGYARVPAAVRAGFEPMIRAYLEGREALRLVWVLVDARHPPTELDIQLVAWLRSIQVPFQVAMTKSDRLSGNQRPRALSTCVQALELDGTDQAVLTSSKTHAGIPTMWRTIERAAAEEPRPTRSRTGEPLSGQSCASLPGDRQERSTDPARPPGRSKEKTTR